MPEGVLTSFTVYDAYRYFAGQAELLMSQSMLSTDYLIPVDNIIVLDRYSYNLTNKSIFWLAFIPFNSIL